MIDKEHWERNKEQFETGLRGEGNFVSFVGKNRLVGNVESRLVHNRQNPST